MSLNSEWILQQSYEFAEFLSKACRAWEKDKRKTHAMLVASSEWSQEHKIYRSNHQILLSEMLSFLTTS